MAQEERRGLVVSVDKNSLRCSRSLQKDLPRNYVRIPKVEVPLPLLFRVQERIQESNLKIGYLWVGIQWCTSGFS
jgi:hypothetical protein